MAKRGFLRTSILVIWGLLMTCLWNSSAVQADNPSNKGGGLSQLEFDRPPVGKAGGSSAPSDHDLEVILEGQKSPPKATPTPVHREDPVTPPTGSGSAGSGPGGSAAGNATGGASAAIKDSKSQRFDWLKPAEGQGHFLIPRLRGPISDAGHPNTISSEVRWDKQNSVCDVSRTDLLCQKAKALKEILVRFSGDVDFFARQCQQKCDDPNAESVLTAFRVKDKKGQSYEIINAGEKCRYQFTSSDSKKTPWLYMEGEGGACTCLPKGCTE